MFGRWAALANRTPRLSDRLVRSPGVIHRSGRRVRRSPRMRTDCPPPAAPRCMFRHMTHSGTTDPLGLHRLGYAKPMLERAAARWEGGQVSERQEQVAEEVPVVLAYNGQSHVVMMAS